VAHLEGQRCSPQDDIKRRAVQHRGRPTEERAAEEARLADWTQCETALEVGEAAVNEQARMLPQQPYS
jgi:hypothetical protein